jgi:membrane fusion protein (multidrug efflux system)
VFVLLLLIALALGAVRGAANWRENYWSFETTENAYVKATVVPVSSQVAAVISEMLVSDNQAVHAGDLLVCLDGRRFEVARAHYEASKVSVVHSQGRATGLLD